MDEIVWRGMTRAQLDAAYTPPAPKEEGWGARLDEALELTFPASDPIAMFGPDRADRTRASACLADASARAPAARN